MVSPQLNTAAFHRRKTILQHITLINTNSPPSRREIFQPVLTLLNAGWIESTHGDYQFYIDGVTPSVARMLEVLDRERVKADFSQR
ncbi:MAG: NAD/NADP octopine/nopaline dehydrogenase family protein [Anaerolineales bacterium]|nr:NAD/NADP octopine/nopaline dehydrogenase family protein [Anaerolineales bacterium]